MGSIEVDAAIVDVPGAAFRFATVRMDPPGPDQVRVRIHACGICHTDLVMQDGALPVPFPVVLGHEGAGVVEAVGKNVTEVHAGDHVLLSFHSCGACAACQDHQPGYCVEFVPRNFMGVTGAEDGGLWLDDRKIGANIFGQSSFATFALAHRDNIIPVDSDVPLDILAPLGCGIQTGAGTILETLKVAAGQSVAILGAGAVGLSALMAAVIAQSGRTVVIDRHDNRLELAGELGATETAAGLEDTAGSFDHIVDTTGVPSLLASAIDRLAPRGTLALVGAYPPGNCAMDASAIMSMGRRIVGVVEGGIDPRTFIPKLIAHYRAGRLPLEKLIRHYSFADLEVAIKASVDGSVIKPILLMSNA